MSLKRRAASALAFALLGHSATATADQGAFQLTRPTIGEPSARPFDGLRIESIDTAMTAFQQMGYGYQSKAGTSLTSPGSERLTVFEP